MSDRGGRPVRFFLLLMTGWTMIRVVATSGWPTAMSKGRDDTSLPPSVVLPVASATIAPEIAPAHAIAPQPRPSMRPPRPIPIAARPSTRQAGAAGRPVDLQAFIDPSNAFADGPDVDDAPGGRQPMLISPPARWSVGQEGASRRWRLGSWALWRAGSGPARTLTDGRLGGSQVGARFEFDLAADAQSRIASYARINAAMDRPASPEAALGLSWQPARRIPLTLALERRIALGPGGRNANALFVAGGFGPKPIGPLLSTEAYVQTGVVGFHAKNAFIDGKLSLLTPVPRSGLHAGMAVSGGAQPEISRLDIGPEVQIHLPLPRVGARLSLELRERIAGNAAPPSGPAVTLAADF